MDENISVVENGQKSAPTVEKKNFLDKLITALLFISFIGGLGAVSLTDSLNTEFVKAGIILTGIISAFILFVLRTLKKSEFALPNNFLSYVLPVLPLAYLVSALVNPAPFVSIVGYGFEIGTVGFIFVMSLLVYLVSISFREKKYIAWFQIILFAIAGLIAVLQILSVLAPSVIAFTGLNTSLINLVGNNNDVAIFFGAILLLSLSALEFAPWGRTGKVFAGVMGLVSLFFLSVFGFTILWIILALFALLLFVALYSFSGKFFPQSGGNKLSYTSLAIVVVSAIFVMFGPQISSQILSKVNVSQGTQVNPPSIEATLPVVSQSFKENYVVGVGPNRFSTEWVKNKPDSVMFNEAWNIDFNYGNSLFLTSIVTTGILGVLAWLIVFASIIYMGIRYVFLGGVDKTHGYLTFSTFILTVYAWISFAIHVPSAGVMTFAFFCTGLFLSSLYSSGLLKTKVVSFAHKPVMSFVLVLTLVLVLIGGVAFDYVIMAKVFASYNYKNAVVSLNNGEYAKARQLMTKAAQFGGSDIYYRGVSDIVVSELRSFASQIEGQPSQSQSQTISDLSVLAQNSAITAQKIDPTSYLNYVAPGTVFSLFASPNSGSTTAYENSKAFYKRALELAPRVPSIYLSLASLEQIHGNVPEAEMYIGKALEMKPNYTQARFLWAQIQIANNNTTKAISVLEDAARLSQYDAGLPFQIGLLWFEKGDYRKAADSFQRVLGLIPSHANAKYYLGLSYEKIGRRTEALKLFEEIKETNQTNEDVDQIIKRLNGNVVIEVPEALDDEVVLDELPLEEDN